MKGAFLVLAGFAVASSGHGAEVTFEGEVKGLFKEYCVKCHGSLFPQKKLKLTSLKHVMKGGESGAVVVPGSPEKSLLVQGLKLPKADVRRMPPAVEGKDLSASQIASIEEWVRQGAR